MKNTNEDFNVLSCFDGMSCGQIALNNIGKKYTNYFASEIEKAPIIVTQANYPNTVQLGDVTKVFAKDLPKIDLLIGGSPCQGFSFSGKQLNFNDERSKLFFEFVRLKNETHPKYFFLENVVMKKYYQDVISKILGCEPIKLNSKIVSAQNRERLYWTNIPFTMPKNLNFTIADILDTTAERKDFDMAKVIKIKKTASCNTFSCSENGKMFQSSRAYFLNKKCGALTKSSAKDINKIWLNDKISYFTINEHELLQTVPINYTNHVSITNRIEMLGNGWTVKIIEAFFKNIGKEPVIRPTTLSLFKNQK